MKYFLILGALSLVWFVISGSAIALLIASIIFQIIIIGVTYQYFKRRRKRLLEGSISPGIAVNNLIFIIIVFIIVSMIVSNYYNDFLRLFLISGMITILIYQVVLYFSGRSSIQQIAMKKREAREFIDSIAHNRDKCQSCFDILEENAQFCTNCGFDNLSPGN